MNASRMPEDASDRLRQQGTCQRKQVVTGRSHSPLTDEVEHVVAAIIRTRQSGCQARTGAHLPREQARNHPDRG